MPGSPNGPSPGLVSPLFCSLLLAISKVVIGVLKCSFCVVVDIFLCLLASFPYLSVFVCFLIYLMIVFCILLSSFFVCVDLFYHGGAWCFVMPQETS